MGLSLGNVRVNLFLKRANLKDTIVLKAMIQDENMAFADLKNNVNNLYWKLAGKDKLFYLLMCVYCLSHWVMIVTAPIIVKLFYDVFEIGLLTMILVYFWCGISSIYYILSPK